MLINLWPFKGAKVSSPGVEWGWRKTWKKLEEEDRITILKKSQSSFLTQHSELDTLKHV